jgi:hypothetical protein
MNTDGLISETMRRVAETATRPIGEDLVRNPPRRWPAIAATVGVVAALIVGVGAIRAATVHDSASLPPASTPTTTDESGTPGESPDVADLVGKDVGLALGLQPLSTNDPAPCQSFAEYTDGMGFCLDSVTEPGTEQMMLLQQIQGYPRSEAMIDYWHTQQRIDELRTENASWAQLGPLYDRQNDDKRTMIREMREYGQ